jgi:hypothetical protein
MSGLLFKFQEVINELEAFAALTESFLAPQSRSVLIALRKSLENYRVEPTSGQLLWQIPQTLPLLTRSSRGYEKSPKTGQHEVHAEVSSVWEICRVRDRRHPKRPAEHFELVGIASTRVRLLCAAPGLADREIAMWRMEIGDSGSPGCHFHVQILGQTTAFPFPSTLPVPRIPSLLTTPASIIEFVLAELFQDEWSKHVARNGSNLQRWSAIQRVRWSNLLTWKLDLIEKSSSPWTTIKMAKPSPSLFA